MSSGPPNKRPRTDSGPTPLKSQLTRDVEFWFSDGSIILIAGNTLFRVYHGVLAAHSVVFHDMLQFPQPPSSPSLDGCPTLDLSDSPADLRHLLRVLYPKPATSVTRFTFSTLTPTLIVFVDGSCAGQRMHRSNSSTSPPSFASPTSTKWTRS